MKLYTEEQVIELCMFFGSYHNYSIEEIKVIIEEEQKPIELPSDEEIGEKANLLQNEEYSFTYNEGINEGFYLGVEYMQQILNQNK